MSAKPVWKRSSGRQSIIFCYFSREVCVRTSQKHALQQHGECEVGRLYSCASRPLSVGSRGTQPNSHVLPSISYSKWTWFSPGPQWLNGETWQHWIPPIQTFRTAAKLQLKTSSESCPYAAVLIGCCLSQRRSSFIRKETRCRSISGKWVLKMLRGCNWHRTCPMADQCRTFGFCYHRIVVVAEVVVVVMQGCYFVFGPLLLRATVTYKAIQLEYVVQYFNKNHPVLIFLWGLPIIMLLINTGSVLDKKIERRCNVLTKEKTWRCRCKIGAFAKKIAGKTSRAKQSLQRETLWHYWNFDRVK
jgi:hypothetical protein